MEGQQMQGACKRQLAKIPQPQTPQGCLARKTTVAT